MRFPKLWGGGNPGVGRGQLNQLNGGAFQTKTFDGGIARAKGDFSEIMMDPPDLQGGWFSSSHIDNGLGTPVLNPHLRTTKTPKIPFKRCSFAFPTGLTGTSNPTALTRPSAMPWAYVFAPDASNNSLRNTKIYKTVDGRAGRTTLIHDLTVARGFFSAQGPDSAFTVDTYDQPSHIDGFPLLHLLNIEFVPEDTLRAKPQLRILFLDSGIWTIGEFDTPPTDANLDYVCNHLTITFPGGWVFAQAETGQFPVIWVTYDYGTNWGGYVADETNFYPGADTTWLFGYDPPGSFGGTLDDQRLSFVLQEEVANFMGLTTLMNIHALSLRRAVVTTVYPTDYMATEWRTAVTVFDLTDGTILEQTVFDHGLPTVLGGVTILGENSFGLILTEPTLHMDVTTDGGATYESVDLPDDLVSLTPVVGTADFSGDDPVWPAIYFVRGTTTSAKVLWRTDDLFTTLKRQSRVGAPEVDPMTVDADARFDYNVVQWSGTQGRPAPCDSAHPWRLDSRVAIPEWWYDGLPH